MTQWHASKTTVLGHVTLHHWYFGTDSTMKQAGSDTFSGECFELAFLREKFSLTQQLIYHSNVLDKTRTLKIKFKN